MEQKNICEGKLTEKETYEALASIASNKYQGNSMCLQKKSITHFATKLNIFLWPLLENQKEKKF